MNSDTIPQTPETEEQNPEHMFLTPKRPGEGRFSLCLSYTPKQSAVGLDELVSQVLFDPPLENAAEIFQQIQSPDPEVRRMALDTLTPVQHVGLQVFLLYQDMMNQSYPEKDSDCCQEGCGCETENSDEHSTPGT